MLEVLVLVLCINGTECTTLTKAYLQHNQELKSDIKSTSKRAVKIMGKESALLVAVSYTALVKQELRAKLPYNFVVKWDFDQKSVDKNVNLNWRYDF